MRHINRLWNGLLLRLWLPTSPSQNWNKQLRLLWSRRFMWGQRTGSVQILRKTLCEYLNDWVTGSSLIKSFIFTIMHAILMCSSFFKGESFLRSGKSLALQLHKCQVERKSSKAGLSSRKTWSVLTSELSDRRAKWPWFLHIYVHSYCSYFRVKSLQIYMLPFKSFKK